MQAANRKRVAVVGAGPAGLTAAYDLCKSGYTVDVFEKESNPGGMLWYGIPEYRLPPEVIQKEIDEITRVGVTIHTDTEIKKKFPTSKITTPSSTPSALERVCASHCLARIRRMFT